MIRMTIWQLKASFGAWISPYAAVQSTKKFLRCNKSFDAVLGRVYENKIWVDNIYSLYIMLLAMSLNGTYQIATANVLHYHRQRFLDGAASEESNDVGMPTDAFHHCNLVQEFIECIRLWALCATNWVHGLIMEKALGYITPLVIY